MVLLDPWWNLAVEEHAAERPHRIGSSRKFITECLLIKDSTNEKIRAQKSKNFYSSTPCSTQENFPTACRWVICFIWW